MATNTLNLNLVKPEMSDYADIRVLNGNMDILDKEIGGLDYVKSVVKSDSGLTFTKKDDTEIQVPLNYLPLIGGTVTGNVNINGELLVHNKAPQYELERLSDTTNELYDISSIKYSNGVLEQVIAFKAFKGESVVSFLIPFSDLDRITLSTGTYSKSTDEYKEPYNDWVWSVANLSTTSAKFKASGYYSYPVYTLKGYWK